MIEKTTYDIICDKMWDWEVIEEHPSKSSIFLPDEVWVLKSEHEALVKKLTREILDLSYDAYITKKKLTELKGKVKK
jgi:hypothetical protein